MNRDPRTCPECGGGRLFQTTTESGGPYGPSLLPSLGTFLSVAKFRVVLCADCGLTRFYASPEAVEKVRGKSRWLPA